MPVFFLQDAEKNPSQTPSLPLIGQMQGHVSSSRPVVSLIKVMSWGKEGEEQICGGLWAHSPVIALIAASSSNHSGLFFQEYIDAHPETIVLDPLPAIRTLLDRSKSYELIRKIEAYMKGMDKCGSAS